MPDIHRASFFRAKKRSRKEQSFGGVFENKTQKFHQNILRINELVFYILLSSNNNFVFLQDDNMIESVKTIETVFLTFILTRHLTGLQYLPTRLPSRNRQRK